MLSFEVKKKTFEISSKYLRYMKIEIHQETMIGTCYLLYLRYQCSHYWNSAFLLLIFRLLKAASGFNVQSSLSWSSDLSLKRQCYVHSVVQLMCQCTFEADVNLDTLSLILMNLLTEVETVTSSSENLSLFCFKTLFFPPKVRRCLFWLTTPSPLQIYIWTIGVKLYFCNLITPSVYGSWITLLELTLRCVFQ